MHQRYSGVNMCYREGGGRHARTYMYSLCTHGRLNLSERPRVCMYVSAILTLFRSVQHLTQTVPTQLSVSLIQAHTADLRCAALSIMCQPDPAAERSTSEAVVLQLAIAGFDILHIPPPLRHLILHNLCARRSFAAVCYPLLQADAAARWHNMRQMCADLSTLEVAHYNPQHVPSFLYVSWCVMPYMHLAGTGCLSRLAICCNDTCLTVCFW
jgi:hypothetical protein